MPSVVFVVDPLATLNVAKDSTIAMINASESRGWNAYCITMDGLYWSDGAPWGRVQRTSINTQFAGNLDPTSLGGSQEWFEAGEPESKPLSSFDAIFMRKDPPFDMNYIYATYILERAEAHGALVVNRPQSLRDHNEKFSIAEFSDLTPQMVVASRADILRDFHAEHRDVIFKILDGMGGTGIFRVRDDDPNLNVVIETLTVNETQPIMAQRYIPEIDAGDKRILIVDGEPIPYALARIPKQGETRGNLAAGASAVPQPLSDRDWEIARYLGPKLAERGLMFVGIDVIGDYLTEINVTCPTCIRELDKAYDIDIAGQLMDAVSKRLN